MYKLSTYRSYYRWLSRIRRNRAFKLVYGSMQSPRINKIANQYSPLPYDNVTSNENDNYYSINAAQKRKINVKSVDKNKISPSNKSIIKSSILNQPNNSQNLRNLKLQKKAMRDSRRSMSEDSTEEMEDMQGSTCKDLIKSLIINYIITN